MSAIGTIQASWSQINLYRIPTILKVVIPVNRSAMLAISLAQLT